MLRFLHKLVRCTSGTVAIETAIVLPIAFTLMTGGVEFGRMLSNYGTIGKSVRDAARYLSHLPDTTAVCGWGLTNAQNLAVYGEITPASGAQPLIPGWALGTISVTQCTSGFNTTPVITVTAAVPYSVLMPTIGLPTSYTLSTQHEERFIGE